MKINNKAFTLIETLVSIVLLGILFGSTFYFFVVLNQKASVSYKLESILLANKIINSLETETVNKKYTEGMWNIKITGKKFKKHIHYSVFVCHKNKPYAKFKLDRIKWKALLYLKF